MILWAILKIDGTFEGEKCSTNRAPKKEYYDSYITPDGYMKTILTIKEYEELKFSWNHEEQIYEKKFNLATKRVKNLTVAEKKNIKDARPQKYRERLTENGDTERVEYTDPKNIDWTNSQVTPQGVNRNDT